MAPSRVNFTSPAADLAHGDVSGYSLPMPRKESRTVRSLHRLENAGNRLPDPLTLFLLTTGVVALVSWAFHGVSADVPQRNGEVHRVAITSLLSTADIHWIFTSAVDNFIGFAPLDPVLTVMLGIGFAARSGLVGAALRAFVSAVPNGAIATPPGWQPTRWSRWARISLLRLSLGSSLPGSIIQTWAPYSRSRAPMDWRPSKSLESPAARISLCCGCDEPTRGLRIAP